MMAVSPLGVSQNNPALGLNRIPALPGINTPLPGGVTGATLLNPSAAQQRPIVIQPQGQPIPLQQVQPQQAQPKAEAEGAKGKGKGKKGGHIPPGLAKKDPASLPDGNPWKQILLEKQAEAKKQQGAAPQGALPPMGQQIAQLSQLMGAQPGQGGGQQIPVLIPIQLQ